MTRMDFEQQYWQYYKNLEERFLKTGNYVFFSTDNYNVYSYEFISLLQVIGSEIDVLFKTICGYPGDNSKNMNNYRTDILAQSPHISVLTVKVSFFDVSVTPFSQLATGMLWWQNYNAVKHDRQGSMNKANLETVLTALAALFLLERVLLSNHLGESAYQFIRSSELFRVEGIDAQAQLRWITKADGSMALVRDDQM